MHDTADITPKPIILDELIKTVSHPSCGAIATFSGVTRNDFNGKTVTSLVYEAYTDMAKQEMLKACTLARDRWPVHSICIVHRIGEVPVGESSIAIAVSSIHRKEALHAVEFLIDRVKATVPIWKKEFYEDGTSNWKENTECFWRQKRTEDQSKCSAPINSEHVNDT